MSSQLSSHTIPHVLLGSMNISTLPLLYVDPPTSLRFPWSLETTINQTIFKGFCLGRSNGESVLSILATYVAQMELVCSTCNTTYSTHACVVRYVTRKEGIPTQTTL